MARPRGSTDLARYDATEEAREAMRHTKGFWRRLAWAYLWWVPVSACLTMVFMRVLKGTWPEIDAGYVLGWLAGGFVYALLLWRVRDRVLHLRP